MQNVCQPMGPPWLLGVCHEAGIVHWHMDFLGCFFTPKQCLFAWKIPLSYPTSPQLLLDDGNHMPSPWWWVNIFMVDINRTQKFTSYSPLPCIKSRNRFFSPKKTKNTCCSSLFGDFVQGQHPKTT